MKDALALALVHFLWQGVVLAAAGACLMRLSKVPSVRYAIGVATMCGMLLAPAATFVAIQASGGPPETTRGGVAAAVHESAAGTSGDRQPSGIALNGSNVESASTNLTALPSTWILSLWAAGVLFLSLRLVGGWTVAHRLATDAIIPVSDELQAMAARLAARMRVRTTVRVCESASIAVPMMLGWLRPVIVLPPAALAGLPLSMTWRWPSAIA
jgi:bla regulator protein BlaR1